MKSKKSDVDSAVTYLFLKKLLTPIHNTEAFKLGLVDNLGRVKREPVLKAEEKALTLLDRIIFKLKRLLGTRLSQLYSFIYLNANSFDTYNTLITLNSHQQSTEIKRLSKNIKVLLENNGFNSLDEYLEYVIVHKEELI